MTHRGLTSLQELDLGFTQRLSTLPLEIGNLAQLIKLTLSRSAITELPERIHQMTHRVW